MHLNGPSSGNVVKKPSARSRSCFAEKEARCRLRGLANLRYFTAIKPARQVVFDNRVIVSNFYGFARDAIWGSGERVIVPGIIINSSVHLLFSN